MTEYIERGALSKFVRDVRKRLPKDSKDFFTRDEMLLNFQQYVDAQPAADVEPVVRSKWELHGGDDSLDCFWFCNNCGWNIEEESDANKWKRCPNCGAHMERSSSGE